MLLCGFQIASLENVFSPDFSVQVLLSFVDSEPGSNGSRVPLLLRAATFPTPQLPCSWLSCCPMRSSLPGDSSPCSCCFLLAAGAVDLAGALATVLRGLRPPPPPQGSLDQKDLEHFPTSTAFSAFKPLQMLGLFAT